MKVQVKHRRPSRRGVVVVASAVIALVAGLTGSAKAQVLDQMPTDALVVVRVSNLGKVSGKIADLAKKLGVDQFAPGAGDPLAALEEEAGISEGLNADSDFGFAFLDPEKTGGQSNAFVMLVPVTDYKAFLTNFPEAETAEGVTAAKRPDGQSVFIKEAGKYAMLSPGRAGIDAAAAGVKIDGAMAKKELEKDVVFIANFDAIRPKVLPMIAEKREFWLAELEKDMTTPRPKFDFDADPNDPAAVDEAQAAELALAKKFVPAAKAAANTGIDMLNAFVRDASSGIYSLNLTDAGLNGTMSAEFTPESYAGKMLAGIKGSKDSMLNGLPAGKYLYFGGMELDPKSLTKAIDDLLNPTMAELQKIDGEEAKTVISMVDSTRKMANASTGSSVGFVAPTGPLGQDALFQMIAITRGDVKTISEAQRASFESQQKFMTLLQGSGIEDAPKTTFQPGARQVDGVTFDAFKTEIGGDANDMDMIQAQQFLSFLYGPEGFAGLTGAIDDKQLLTVSGLKPEGISGAIAAAKSGEDVLGKSAPLKLTTDAMPAERVLAVYVPLDVILGTGLDLAKQNGMAIPVNIGQDLPPIGFTAGTEGPAARMDWHLPTPLVQNIVGAALQLYLGMAPNMGGGAGPAEPPMGP